MVLPYLIRLGTRLQTGLAQTPEEYRQRHGQFLLSRQLPSGGFSGRDVDLSGQPLFEDGVQADLYYTSFALRGLVGLGQLNAETAKHVAGWLGRQAGRCHTVIDLVSWLSSALAIQMASGIDLLAQAPDDWSVRLAQRLESFRTADGGYTKSAAGAQGSTYHSFLVALCYELIGQTLPEPKRLIEFVLNRQRDDGGFVEMAAMRRSGTNPTAAAVALLSMLGGLDADTMARTVPFLIEVRGDDGGFQANTRVPFSDTLSTFTGYLTSLELGQAELLPAPRLQRFLNALEQPEGGYLAAGWDRLADVEYTFYALGCQALLRSEGTPQAVSGR